MPAIGTVPLARLGFEPHMADARNDRALEWAEHDAGAMTAGQRSQPTKHLIVDASGDFDVEAAHPFDERSHHFRPDQSVGTAHHDQPFRRDADFPGCSRAQPASHVYCHDWAVSGMLGEQRQADSSHAGAG